MLEMANCNKCACVCLCYRRKRDFHFFFFKSRKTHFFPIKTVLLLKMFNPPFEKQQKNDNHQLMALSLTRKKNHSIQQQVANESDVVSTNRFLSKSANQMELPNHNLLNSHLKLFEEGFI